MRKPFPTLWICSSLLSVTTILPCAEQAPPEEKRAWQNQSDWLVNEIVGDLTEMAIFAGTGKDPRDANYQLKVTTPPRATPPEEISSCEVKLTSPKGNAELAVKMQRHFFAPENYSPWVRKLAEIWKLEPDSVAVSDDAACMTALLSPDYVTILAENRRISEGLAQHPRSGAWHDQAALLIGTQALRDFSGRYRDVRRPLCRMTAHLALARVLQPLPGPCGQLAEAVQLTLATRQAEALEALETLPAGTEGWQRALKLRNTGDWRLLQNPSDATLLEQLMGAWAGVNSINDRWLLDFFRATQLPDAPDWSRLGLSVQFFGIEVGHTFATRGVATEEKALRETWCKMHDKVFPEESLLDVLNELPTGGVVRSADGKVSLVALSWGSLADFHQRNLCHALGAAHHFLNRTLGMPKEAAAVSRDGEIRFGGLRLFPSVRSGMLALAGDPRRGSQAAPMLALATAHPETLPLDAWAATIMHTSGSQPKELMPVDAIYGHWRGSGLPWGTGFEAESATTMYHPGGFTLATWEALCRIAPFQPRLANSRIRSLYKDTVADAAALQKEFGALAEFNLDVMKQIGTAPSKDLKLCKESLERAAELEPGTWFTLGDLMQGSGAADDEVAAIYEKGVASRASALQIANSVHWLAGYYIDHGRNEDALRLAKQAADVYSARGLETAAFVMEKLDRLGDAENLLRASASRYPGGVANRALYAFIGRHPELSPEEAATYQKTMGQIFPKGVEPADLALFQTTNAAPTDGVKLRRFASLRTRRGLESDHTIVVAVDGSRVRSLNDFLFFRARSNEVLMKMIIWDGTTWKEVSARRWDNAIFPEPLKPAKAP